VDMIVHPDYQWSGIGRQIMQNLQGRLKGFLVAGESAAGGGALPAANVAMTALQASAALGVNLPA